MIQNIRQLTVYKYYSIQVITIYTILQNNFVAIKKSNSINNN